MPPTNLYSVSELTAYIKSLFTQDVLLGDVWLSGEVSNFKLATSGHCYFTLKDGTASIKTVIWRTTLANRSQRMALPRDGDAVIAHGYVSVYEPQGAYQLYVDHLETAGAGRLWLEFERLKARLEAEGLFDLERKRPIPAQPRRLGIVTSATAAALQDILRTLAGRYPLVDVILASTAVQGDHAPQGIVTAIEALNRWSIEQEPLDIIIVARGGGSIEELWAFNDERVARAIRASTIPVIVGVGHETDFTIADFAADLRAPTPTGAATLATPDARELRARVAGLAAAAQMHILQRVGDRRDQARGLGERLLRQSPERRIAGDRQRIDDLIRRAGLAGGALLCSRRERLNGVRLHLSALDPSRVLARGYAIVTAAQGGAVVTSKGQVAAGDVIRVRVVDGTFDAEVEDSHV